MSSFFVVECRPTDVRCTGLQELYVPYARGSIRMVVLGLTRPRNPSAVHAVEGLLLSVSSTGSNNSHGTSPMRHSSQPSALQFSERLRCTVRRSIRRAQMCCPLFDCNAMLRLLIDGFVRMEEARSSLIEMFVKLSRF